MTSENREQNEHFRRTVSIDRLSVSIRGTAAVLAQGAWQMVIALKHRRSLALLADCDDRTLADIGLMRSDLYAARSEPFWQEPTSIVATHPDRIREWVVSHGPRY